ncbi:hypothetical protein BX600DRAFT_433598 [Xylariales sp. PMI_506]|nr:hypothetical protein BX600DRAFT_433598 [Xylariales sp. PMI_506]
MVVVALEVRVFYQRQDSQCGKAMSSNKNDDEGEQLSHPDFWNERYANAEGDQPTHEWFRSYKDLEAFLEKHLFHSRTPETRPRILHMGSGDSTIPQDLAAKGYNNQLCIDFSEVVVSLMSKRHEGEPGIEWKQMDLRQMDGIESKSIDVAFDKSTLDAMIYGSPWSPPEQVRDNTSRYIREIDVLGEAGSFGYYGFNLSKKLPTSE